MRKPLSRTIFRLVIHTLRWRGGQMGVNYPSTLVPQTHWSPQDDRHLLSLTFAWCSCLPTSHMDFSSSNSCLSLQPVQMLFLSWTLPPSVRGESLPPLQVTDTSILSSKLSRPHAHQVSPELLCGHSVYHSRINT